MKTTCFCILFYRLKREVYKYVRYKCILKHLFQFRDMCLISRKIIFAKQINLLLFLTDSLIIIFHFFTYNVITFNLYVLYVTKKWRTTSYFVKKINLWWCKYISCCFIENLFTYTFDFFFNISHYSCHINIIYIIRK